MNGQIAKMHEQIAEIERKRDYFVDHFAKYFDKIGQEV